MDFDQAEAAIAKAKQPPGKELTRFQIGGNHLMDFFDGLNGLSLLHDAEKKSVIASLRDPESNTLEATVYSAAADYLESQLPTDQASG